MLVEGLGAPLLMDAFKLHLCLETEAFLLLVFDHYIIWHYFDHEIVTFLKMQVCIGLDSWNELSPIVHSLA